MDWTSELWAPGVDDVIKIYQGKQPISDMFFFLNSIAQWSLEEDNTIMSKVTKGKGKTRGKNEKT